MNEAAKEARRKYVREWQRNNKDKVKAAQERYWTRKAQAAAEQATTAEEINEDGKNLL